jgi:hypothetical protein
MSEIVGERSRHHNCGAAGSDRTMQIIQQMLDTVEQKGG